MRHARVIGLVAAAITAAATAVVFAQATVTPVPDNAPVQTAPLVEKPATWGDVKAGATKAGTCAACHGLDGNPTDPQYPRLAGQSERYIAHQLQLFRTGQRTAGMAAVMMPFAQALTAQDARDLGAYFATQKAGAGVADDAVIASGPYKDKRFYEVGQQLFRTGDPARDVPACMGCHGPTGAGNPGPAYPALAGQQSAYVKRRLEDYRALDAGAQKDPLIGMMAGIAGRLTDEEVGALASYVQGLHPRADDVAAEAASTAAR